VGSWGSIPKTIPFYFSAMNTIVKVNCPSKRKPQPLPRPFLNAFWRALIFLI